MASEPLYMRVERDLRARIAAKEWDENAYLPSEQSLIAAYRVSRTTIRKAISDLVAQGVVVIERGNGTKIVPRATTVESLLSFSQMLEAMGKTPGLARHDVGIERPPAHIADLFRDHDGDQLLVLRRVHTADGVPVSVSESWLTMEPFAGLSLSHLSDQTSLYTQLNALGRPITSVTDTFSLFPVEQAQAECLGMNVGDASLKIERRGLDSAGVLMEYSTIIVHPERYQPTYVTRRSV